MKTVRILSAVTLGFFSVSTLAGCNPRNTLQPEPNKSISYSDIYKAPEYGGDIVCNGIYKASYGYTNNSKQGYNCFYYCYLDGDSKEMTFDGKKWIGECAEIIEGSMFSSAESSAQRCFISPMDGEEVHIFGNPKLLSGQSAKVNVSVDGVMLFESIVSDKFGVYHSDVVLLKKGQKITFTVYGDAEVYWNPTVDYNNADEELLHYATDGYFGDVHPFYKDGKLYMYYLSTGLETSSVHEKFTSLLETSDDMLHFKRTPVYEDKKNPPDINTYFALGVYEDAEGVFRSCYGIGCGVGGSASDDLINWRNGAEIYIDEADDFLKYTHKVYFASDVYSGRDPYIYYDKDTEKYFCVVINYYSSRLDGGEKGLALYTAGRDGKYSTESTKLLSFTSKGDPECPEIMKIGDRWYLFYSELGTGSAGVGKLSYRIGEKNVLPQNDDWNSKMEYSLDGGNLHAAQVFSVGDKYYMSGWINYQAEANVWGGYLNLPREVYQLPDGTLGTRCDEYLTDLLINGKIADFNSIDTNLIDLDRLENGVVAMNNAGSAELKGLYGRVLLTADISLSNNSEFTGFTFKQNGIVYYAGLIRKNDELYLSISKTPDELSSAYVKIRDNGQIDFKLKVISDGSFIEAFVNDKYSVTMKTCISFTKSNLGLKLSGKETKAENVTVYKLADKNNIFD